MPYYLMYIFRNWAVQAEYGVVVAVGGSVTVFAAYIPSFGGKELSLQRGELT